MKGIFISNYGTPMTRKEFRELLKKIKFVSGFTMEFAGIKDFPAFKKEFNTLIVDPSLLKWVTKKMRQEFKIGFWVNASVANDVSDIVKAEKLRGKFDFLLVDYARCSDEKFPSFDNSWGNALAYMGEKLENESIYWCVKPESMLSLFGIHAGWGQDVRKAIKETNWKICPMEYYHEQHNTKWNAWLTLLKCRFYKWLLKDKFVPIFPAFAEGKTEYPIKELWKEWPHDYIVYSLNCLGGKNQ